MFFAITSLGPFNGEPELAMGVLFRVGVDIGVWSYSSEDLLTVEVAALVVLDRIRVVPVPWTVVPPKLVSLVLVLCFNGDCTA